MAYFFDIDELLLIYIKTNSERSEIDSKATEAFILTYLYIYQKFYFTETIIVLANNLEPRFIKSGNYFITEYWNKTQFTQEWFSKHNEHPCYICKLS